MITILFLNFFINANWIEELLGKNRHEIEDSSVLKMEYQEKNLQKSCFDEDRLEELCDYNLEKVEFLYLFRDGCSEDQKITGKSFKTISACIPNLKGIDLDFNRVEAKYLGDLPVGIEQIKVIGNRSLINGDFSGVQKLKNLKSINFQDVALSQTAFDSIQSESIKYLVSLDPRNLTSIGNTSRNMPQLAHLEFFYRPQKWSMPLDMAEKFLSKSWAFEVILPINPFGEDLTTSKRFAEISPSVSIGLNSDVEEISVLRKRKSYSDLTVIFPVSVNKEIIAELGAKATRRVGFTLDFLPLMKMQNFDDLIFSVEELMNSFNLTGKSITFDKSFSSIFLMDTSEGKCDVNKKIASALEKLAKENTLALEILVTGWDWSPLEIKRAPLSIPLKAVKEKDSCHLVLKEN